MSNYLAIATATATLRDILQEAVTGIIPEVDISTERPDQKLLENKARINAFLYQVTPNATWRNMNLPTRGHGGMVKQRPQVALDLYYLLSFYGNESELVPQRLLGSVVSRLNSEPILTSTRINDVIANTTDSSSNQYLENSDLAEQIERVKFTPLALNLEELSKLWSLLVYNAPYALSVTYQASVVLIEEEITPKPALPVRESKLLVKSFRQPVIESISPAIADGHITAGSEIIIKGQNLNADHVNVTFGGLEGMSEPNEVNDKQITVTLPPELRAGVNSVQVLHELYFGTSEAPDPHKGFESNVAAFVLRPTITVESADLATVTLTFAPMVGKTQRVVLLLNSIATPTTAHSFNAPKDNGIANDDEETNSIAFSISNVDAGDYLVRVQVDGAVSLSDGDGPTVTIPS